MSQFDSKPPMLAVDANGYVWRVYPEYWSMCPVNPDNEPVPEPVTFYAPIEHGWARTGADAKVAPPDAAPKETCPDCGGIGLVMTGSDSFSQGADPCENNWHDAAPKE